MVDSVCTYTRINKQLVKEERIKTELIDMLFEVFNVDGMKKWRSHLIYTTRSQDQ